MSYSIALSSYAKFHGAPPLRCARLGIRRSLYDFKSDLEVLPPCDRVHNRANRFCGTALLADHPSEIFLRNPQLEHRGSLALRLLDLHSIRIVYQLLCDELNELLHGVTPLKKSKGSSYKPPSPSLVLTTSYRYAKTQERFIVNLSQCSAREDSPWIRGSTQSWLARSFAPDHITDLAIL